jgi:hypothetical protein
MKFMAVGRAILDEREVFALSNIQNNLRQFKILD